jgi:predicted  nucleic acid-binding Zn-ribbon protein
MTIVATRANGQGHGARPDRPAPAPTTAPPAPVPVRDIAPSPPPAAAIRAATPLDGLIQLIERVRSFDEAWQAERDRTRAEIEALPGRFAAAAATRIPELIRQAVEERFAGINRAISAINQHFDAATKALSAHYDAIEALKANLEGIARRVATLGEEGRRSDEANRSRQAELDALLGRVQVCERMCTALEQSSLEAVKAWDLNALLDRLAQVSRTVTTLSRAVEPALGEGGTLARALERIAVLEQSGSPAGAARPAPARAAAPRPWREADLDDETPIAPARWAGLDGPHRAAFASAGAVRILGRRLRQAYAAARLPVAVGKHRQYPVRVLRAYAAWLESAASHPTDASWVDYFLDRVAGHLRGIEPGATGG